MVTQILTLSKIIGRTGDAFNCLLGWLGKYSGKICGFVSGKNPTKQIVVRLTKP